MQAPTGAVRAGPSLGALAIAYDLNYDGWDENFRKKVAAAIEGYNEGSNMSLEELACGARHGPGSNHRGPQIGGAALALLAIQNDPGVDHAKVQKMLDANAKAFVRQMTEGWGDHGWVAEGDGPGAISSDTALVPAIQAWKIAGGEDFISPWPNVQWMTLKWAMLTLPPAATTSTPNAAATPTTSEPETACRAPARSPKDSAPSRRNTSPPCYGFTTIHFATATKKPAHRSTRHVHIRTGPGSRSSTGPLDRRTASFSTSLRRADRSACQASARPGKPTPA